MANMAMLEEIEKAELIFAVDATRPPPSRFKLLAADRTELIARLAASKASNAATLSMGGTQITAQGTMRAAFDLLTARLRDGFNFIKAIPGFEITEPERDGLFTTYGWESGVIGELPDARVEFLANQAITVTPTISNLAWRYSDNLLTHITTQLGIVNANQPSVQGGTVQGLFDLRDLDSAKLKTMNDRVRFFYCSASDEKDQTPELGRIGVTTPVKYSCSLSPTHPGTVTFNPATNELEVIALPAHATTLRAYRRPAGGEAVFCGSSPTVTVLGAGPLTPGVTYEFWVVGKNFRGEGPESNHVTFVATS
ncbi:MAG: fibronectin type III domain-containing protein [Planctomycetota bacterium]